MALIELTLPVEIDEAWAHLREPALIRRWFGWDYEGLDHEIEVIFLQEAAVDDVSHTLRWDDGMQEGDRIELAGGGVETILRVVRASGAEGYDDISEGWISFAQQLRFALERHRGEDRRTLRLSRSEGAGPRPGLTDAAAGARYKTVAAGPISGEVLFRMEHQLGLTVDQLGDGLLLLTEKPGGGSASLTLTTYGAAQPDEAAWRAWWEEP